MPEAQGGAMGAERRRDGASAAAVAVRVFHTLGDVYTQCTCCIFHASMCHPARAQIEFCASGRFLHTDGRRLPVRDVRRRLCLDSSYHTHDSREFYAPCGVARAVNGSGGLSELFCSARIASARHAVVVLHADAGSLSLSSAHLLQRTTSLWRPMPRTTCTPCTGHTASTHARVEKGSGNETSAMRRSE
jgi:hypothetical protein